MRVGSTVLYKKVRSEWRWCGDDRDQRDVKSGLVLGRQLGSRWSLGCRLCTRALSARYATRRLSNCPGSKRSRIRAYTCATYTWDLSVVGIVFFWNIS